MKRPLLFLLLVISAKMALSQTKFLPSPNAASLGIFGSIEISPFNGLPDIGIDVFSLNQGGIKVNGRLSYFAGGVKPESHPGWVGQNFSLNVGGVITRKQNGGIDEVYVSNLTNPDAIAYYFNYNLLNSGNWSTTAFIQNLRPNNSNGGSYADINPDEFFFTLPNGISGSFLLNDQGQWKVKSKQAGNLKISVDLNPESFVLKNYNNPGRLIHIRRLIYKIIITDQDGMQYTFGNTPNSIEFIRGRQEVNAENYEDVIANSWYLTKIISPKGDLVNFVYERRENQYFQNITYSKTFNVNFPGYLTSSSAAISPGSQMITPSYLTEINSSSFKVNFSISPTTELKYNYISSALNGYTHGDIDYTVINDNITKDGVALLQQSPPKWYKLDNITIQDQNNTIKQNLGFIYNNVATERLFLKTFRRFGVGGDHGFVDYNFEYNQTPLPAYNALQCDQWGYYNGKAFPENTSGMNKNQVMAYLDADTNYMKAGSLIKIIYPTGGTTNLVYESNDYSHYLQKSTSSVNLINQYGIGGGIRIRSIIDNDANGGQYKKQYYYTSSETPGVSSGILAGNKQLYVNAVIGNPMLASVDFMSSNTFGDLNYTEGKDVVYSEVKEVLPDGSYNIFNYTNSDNSTYKDEAPANLCSDAYLATGFVNYNSSAQPPSGSYPVLSFISRELERGQLLSKKTYSASNKLVYQLDNQYRDDVERFTEYIKLWRESSVTVSGPQALATERYFQAIKIYTYFPYLKNSIETVWDINGLNPYSTATSYTYNPSNRLLAQQITNGSKTEEIKTTYKYPVDMTAANDPSGIYQNMVNINQISPVIEKRVYRAGNQINFERVNFSSPYSGTYLPQTVESQTSSSASPETRVHYLYNQKGNVVSEAKTLGTQTSYQWDATGQFPVLEAINASANDIFYDGFEEGNGNTLQGDAKTGSYSFTGTYSKSLAGLDPGTYTLSYWRKSDGTWFHVIDNAVSVTGGTYVISLPTGQIDGICFYPTGAMVNAYTYNSLVGMTSKMDVKGQIIYYEYDGYGRLKNVKDQDSNIIKHLDYHFQVQ